MIGISRSGYEDILTVNDVVDVLRDVKALYSITEKYIYMDRKGKDIRMYGPPYIDESTLTNIEIATGLACIILKIKEIKKKISRESKKPLSSKELRKRIKENKKWLVQETINDKKGQKCNPLIRKMLDKNLEIVDFLIDIAIDFTSTAKSNYYRSKRSRVYISDISKGSVVVTLIGVSNVILCFAIMGTAIYYAEKGREIEFSCMPPQLKIKKP